MRSEMKWRLLLTLVLTVMSGYFIWKNGINLGLDLVGGMHLVLEVDTEAVFKRELVTVQNDGLEALQKSKITPASFSSDAGQVSFVFSSPEQLDEAKAVLNKTILGYDEHYNAGTLTANFRLKPSQVKQISDDALDRTLETIRNRVDQFGTREPVIQRQGLTGNRILIQLPEVKDVERAKSIIGRTAALEFKIVKEGPATTEEELLKSYAGKVPDGFEVLPGGRKNDAGAPIAEFYLLDKSSPVTGADLETASVGSDQNGLPAVNYKLKSDAADRMSAFSGKNVQKQMAIILDSKVQSAPVIRERLHRDIQISGHFSMQEAKDLALVLRAGALPAPVRYLEERTVGASLGADSVRRSKNAMIAGLIAVVLFMLVYYRLSGLISDIGLMFTFFWLLGGLAMFNATFTLPGFAALILTAGMAVDASVLVFERIREEMKNKKTIRTAISTGYSRATLTILDANITTLIAGIVLLQFGTGPVKGFAVALSIGILTSVISCLATSRLFFDVLNTGNVIKSIKYLEVFGDRSVDFLKPMMINITASAVIVCGGWLSGFTLTPPNWGIDFSGGGLFQLHFPQTTAIGDVRNTIEPLGFKNAVIQKFGEETEILLRLQITPEEVESTATKLRTALDAKFPGASIVRQESVGPQVGADLKTSAVLAVLASLVGILIYIAFRFEFRYALGAVIATVHDMLITIAAILIFHVEISTTVVAALLTVVGYSINDTIVVFDRIRDNRRFMKKANLYEIMNASVNQTLSRTILTAGTTLLTVLSLYFLGGETIRPFAFVLLVGIVVGTYSSIYIASPTVLLFEKFLMPKAEAATGKTRKQRVVK